MVVVEKREVRVLPEELAQLPVAGGVVVEAVVAGNEQVRGPGRSHEKEAGRLGRDAPQERAHTGTVT